MKYLIGILVLILTTNCNPDSELETDYQVYSAVLIKTNDINNLTVVTSETVIGFDASIDQLKRDLEGLQDETIDDFNKKSKENIQLENKFSQRLNVKLFSKIEHDKIFEKTKDLDNAWRIFYTKYKKAQGITTFSRIGYNKERTQALVYHGTGQGSLAGEGYYSLCEIRFGHWKEISRTEVWIS